MRPVAVSQPSPRRVCAPGAPPFRDDLAFVGGRVTRYGHVMVEGCAYPVGLVHQRDDGRWTYHLGSEAGGVFEDRERARLACVDALVSVSPTA